MKFKPQSADLQKSNILNGGASFRWFGLSRTETGNLSVELNNTQLAELAEFPLSLNQWHDIVCAVDLDKAIIGVSVDLEAEGSWLTALDRIVGLQRDFWLTSD